jgi:hypothetical protein
MSDKIFVKGLYADQKNSQYGGFMKISAKVSEVVEFLKEHENEKGYVHINVFQVKDKKEGKNSHYCILDTWKPSEQAQPSAQTQDVAEESRDLPF